MSLAARPLLGCIADDFTGATDLANILVREGMRTVQTIDVPDLHAQANLDADAIVIALKTRTAPVADAIERSLAALAWLRAEGCEQFFFKYCSTFDSTDDGNIGPVADALMQALGSPFAIACPAFPQAGRTLFHGHLFVHDTLLSESGMAQHPLTPMHDSNLVRVLSKQTRRRVGLLPWESVSQGVDKVRETQTQLRQAGVQLAIADAICDDDLRVLGRACADHRLITGGSGIALGLPDNFRAKGRLRTNDAGALFHIAGPTLILAGSGSQATQRQVAAWLAAQRPAYRIDPLALAHDEEAVIEAALRVARQSLLIKRVPMIYATSSAEEVKAVQARLGIKHAGEMIESALARIAGILRDEGVRRFVVAGGETSGAVVGSLKIRRLRIGPQIDPGVPLTITADHDVPLAVVLKSGNFGSDDFFEKTLRRLDGDWTDGAAQ